MNNECVFVLGAVVVVRDCHRYGPVSPTFARADFFPSSLLVCIHIYLESFSSYYKCSLGSLGTVKAVVRLARKYCNIFS